MKRELGQLCEWGNGEWMAAAGTRRGAHPLCNAFIFVGAGLSQSPVWSLLASLGIGFLTGGWGLCTSLSNTLKEEVETLLWCSHQGIVNFPPAERRNAGVIPILLNSFTQTRAWCLQCEASLVDVNSWKNLCWLMLWVTLPNSVLVPSSLFLFTSVLLVIFPGSCSFIHVITAESLLPAVWHFTRGTAHLFGNQQSITNGLLQPHGRSQTSLRGTRRKTHTPRFIRSSDYISAGRKTSACKYE